MSSTYKSYKYQDPFKNNTPGATAKNIAAAARGKAKPKKSKQLSAAMTAWVEANRGRLEQPTDKQKAIFKQYDALKKEGRLPSTSSVKSRPSPQAQPSARPRAAGNKPVQKQSRVQKATQSVQQSNKGKQNLSKLRMADHPAAPKSSKKTKQPAFKVIKGVLHVLRGGKYVPTKKSR